MPLHGALQLQGRPHLDVSIRLFMESATPQQSDRGAEAVYNRASHRTGTER